ncbi:hypothetical protein OAN307_c39300 [Octadecabacter antarcticus 307]|uniref:Uncharacterized protein n=1 Tax=Octadecabacter antarcticus 307 TaxID=391626 RepID=M9RHQ3_9RHOB|nr:hypothetical protein [Octadecabacter antarcticus]AGI69360.1 hypothetical protein OAN307_c39300 [Octadecabacter antarcticus 307]
MWLVLAIVAGAWLLHQYDKASAVAAARDGFVSEFEQSAAEAKRDALLRRVIVSDEANRGLLEKVHAVEGEAQRFTMEIEAFENETTVNPAGVVDADLLRWMRSN